MFALTNIIGFLATATAGAMSPIQLITLLRANDRRSVSTTVSLPTVMLVCVCQMCWLVYGAQYNVVWTVVLATISLCTQVAILIVCIAVRTIHLRYVVYLASTLVVTAAVALLLTKPSLGLIASILSMVNYLPAAYRTWQTMRDARAHGHAATSVYSLPMGIAMVTTNVLWIIYAVLIRDFWVGFPCVVNTAVGALLCIANVRMARSTHTTARINYTSRS